MISLFWKKLIELFGFYSINSQTVYTGQICWITLIDLLITVITCAVLIHFVIKSYKNYMSYKGATSDLYMLVICILGFIMIGIRLWTNVTFRSFQYMSIMYCICHMLVLYYFSLMILYSPSMVDSKRSRQFTRIFAVLFISAVSVYLFSSIEYQSSPTTIIKDKLNLNMSLIESVINLDRISVKSFLPNTLVFIYSFIMCIVMLIHVKKSKLNKLHKYSYYLFMIIHLFIFINSIQLIFYTNYADLKYSRLVLSEYVRDAPAIFNTYVFTILLYVYNIGDNLNATINDFLGMHNAIFSYMYRLIYIIGFALNAQFIIDNKNIRKLEEKQMKKLKKLKKV